MEPTYTNDDPPTPPPHPVAGALRNKSSYHPSFHAHPRQQVNDYGPQVRQSRLPIFKQVRSMLNRPAPIASPGNAKWDEYTGELSDQGKTPHVKPSTYESAFQVSRKRSPERPSRSKRNLSPVSILRDEEIMAVPPLQVSRHSPQDMSPVSPVSPISPSLDYNYDAHSEFVPDMMPEPLSPNVQRAPLPPHTPPSSQQIKRKPVSRCVSSIENQPPGSPTQRSPSETSDAGKRFSGQSVSEEQTHPNSHFSWTTYAPSIAVGRPSTDTTATRRSNYASGYRQPIRDPKQSHFSWSTVNTAMTQRARPASPPETPRQAVIVQCSGPPVQSILSRQRPIKRNDKEEWTPSPQATSVGDSDSLKAITRLNIRTSPLPRNRNTPNSATQSPSSAMTDRSGNGKALPPPPPSEISLSHLESLQSQERSIALQKRNMEKGIAELEKIEKASPLEVPFATVRDAKKRLAEYRKRLAEVVLEEREIGIAITRARRKEEAENGWDGESTLWVRRVTS